MRAFHTRPISVTILSVFVLCITSWNLLRIFSALASWNILREFGASPAYLLGSGLVWTVSGAWLIVTLWRAEPHALPAGLSLAGLYFAWYWIDRLFIQADPAPNFVSSAFISTTLLVCVIIDLFASKSFFDKEQG